MSLKQCPDCHKEYSFRAANCIHCGAPNEHFQAPEQTVVVAKDDENSVWSWIVGAVIIAAIVLAMVPDLRVYVLRMINPNTDVVTENEMRSCDSTGAYNQMKSAFDQSQYALSLNLKAVDIKTMSLDTAAGSTMTCQADIMLNNGEDIRYVFNFTEQGDQYLISGEQAGET